MSEWQLVPYTVESVWINRAAVILTAIHHSLLFLRVVIDQCKTRELSIENKYQFRLYVMTIITMFSFVLGAVFFGPLGAFEIFYPYIPCNTSLTLGILTFWFGKYCLWLFSILRICIVFNSELTMRYKPIVIKILLICFTFVFIMVNITSIGWCGGTHKYLPSNSQMSYCEIQCAMWVSGPNGMSDQIATIICFLLFYKRLKLLMKNVDSQDTKLLYIIRKYTILMATYIISMWMMMFFSTFLFPYVGVIGLFDGMTNMWSLVLFDTRYDNIYQTVFKCVARSDLLVVANLQPDVSKVASKSSGTSMNEQKREKETTITENVDHDHDVSVNTNKQRIGTVEFVIHDA
eukprot:490930_1